MPLKVPPNFPENAPTEIWIDLDKRENDLVNISCIVEADPPARFNWFSVDGIPISDGRFRNQVVNMSEDENRSVLTVRYQPPPKEAHENRGRMNQITRFRCKASNHFGEKEAVYEIKTGSSPISPRVFDHKYGSGECQEVNYHLII